MKGQIPGTTIKRPAETEIARIKLISGRLGTAEKGARDIQRDYASPLRSECNALRESCAGGRRTKVEESINSC